MKNCADILQQDDLLLRPLTQADLPTIARDLGDARVARWLAAVRQPFDAAAADEILAHSRDPGEMMRVIEQDGAVVGGLCIGAALWYWLTPDCWGQGLMQRALRMAIGARFCLPAPPVVATCHDDNTASQQLLTRLGFAPCPDGRRMFFHATQRAAPCRDYLLTPEQWHLLNPRIMTVGHTTLRPALQKDAPALVHILPCPGAEPWPDHEMLNAFIETHRFRGPARGLFVVQDENRRSIGAALVQSNRTSLRFLSDEDKARHCTNVNKALEDGRFQQL